MKQYLQYINKKTIGANGLSLSIVLYLIFVIIDIATNDTTSIMGFYTTMVICAGSVLGIHYITEYIIKKFYK